MLCHAGMLSCTLHRHKAWTCKQHRNAFNALHTQQYDPSQAAGAQHCNAFNALHTQQYDPSQAAGAQHCNASDAESRLHCVIYEAHNVERLQHTCSSMRPIDKFLERLMTW
jgi:hypothetical protein